jgi:hypothetical protein
LGPGGAREKAAEVLAFHERLDAGVTSRDDVPLVRSATGSTVAERAHRTEEVDEVSVTKDEIERLALNIGAQQRRENRKRVTSH